MHRSHLLGVILVSALTASALLTAAPATSQPDVRFPVEQPAPVSARVALLEQRLHRVEQRLAAFESIGVKQRADGARELTINGARLVIARDGRVSVTPGQPTGNRPTLTGRLPPDCDPPYSVAPGGVRTPKPECLGEGAPCDPPFSVDDSGIKRYKRGCL